MNKAEELKLAFAKKWKYLIVLNDKMFYQFDDELNELLDEQIKLAHDEWKSNQEGE